MPITNLFINNIVLIEKQYIPFEDGFCVLTGETGAGKSILLDALGLAIGKRASASLIRAGQKQGSVTASFDVSKSPAIIDFLAEQGISSDGELLLRRVVFSDGKTKAFINDNPVSASMLAEFGQSLIEIHGQHDQRGLLNAKTHRDVLDQYGQLDNHLARVAKAYQTYSDLKQQLDELREGEAKAAADEDYLKFVLNELTNLAPEVGLEEELANKRSNLLNRDKLIETINSASEIIDNGTTEDAIRSAQNILLKAADINSNFAEIAEMLERALIEIAEASSALNAQSGKIDESEEDLEAIEERLFGLRDAARKYGVEVDDLADHRDKVADKLSLIENKDEKIAELEKQVVAAREDFITVSSKLSAARKKAATKFEKTLAAELKPLKMENTKLQVQIERLEESAWSKAGFDRISFFVQTNPGSPFAPIAKIASGGELSRFMLALKVVLSDVNSVPTMIFDEVDTGIGGAVADAVGRRLAKLGEKLQVFAITHQPQVAAKGSYHLKVQKTVSKSGTTTNVSPLADIERREELARMLAGDVISDEARSAADKLLVV